MIDRSKPSFRIEIGGKSQKELACHVKKISVEQSVISVEMFSIDIAGTGANKWLNDERLNPGDQDIKIYMGYEGQDLKLLISGMVSSLDYALSLNESDILTVQGFDYSTKLQKSYINKGSGFKELKISDIVRNIANEHSLKCVCDSTEITYNSKKTDLNESDYSFLKRMADAIGYLFYIRDMTIYFLKPNYSNPSRTLSWKRSGNEKVDGLSKMDLRLSAAGVVKVIEVRGYNPKENRPLISKVHPYYKQIADPRGELKANNVPNTNQMDLDLIAQSMMDNASHLVEIRATMLGDPTLRAGDAIRVADISDRFDGIYYITGAKHAIEDVYTVSLQLTGPIK
jgi:uncharacterized protein